MLNFWQILIQGKERWSVLPAVRTTGMPANKLKDIDKNGRVCYS